MDTFNQALQITLIGMGLVFIGLLLLWGLMELTVQLTAWYNRRHPEEEEGEEEEAEVEAVVEEAPVAALPAPSALKQKAAAAAVAIALALEEGAPAGMAASLPAGYTAQASAWQAVMRSAQLNQRSNNFTRKPRGSAR